MDSINIVIIVLFIILSVTYAYLNRRFTYWKRKNLEYLEPTLFFGNTKKFAKGELSFGEQFKELYKKLKEKGIKKHGGVYLFFSPIYMPLEPEVIKCILQKDFDHFRNHGIYVNEESDPLTGHLFNLEDAKWRNIRTKLTPTFTSGKMKMMFSALTECSKGLKDLLDDHAISRHPVDIKDVASRYTTDVIASCAFGLECDSLANPNTEFRKYGKKIFDGGFVSRMKLLITMAVPRNILAKVGFKFFGEDVEAFFYNLVKNTMKYREKNKIYHRDIFHFLLQLKNPSEAIDTKEGYKNVGLSVNEIAAQCLGFFVAGSDTSATTMTFALYEVAKNEIIQEKLRNEIVMVLEKHDNKLTYESIMEMTYFDNIVYETLRKYPPAPGTPRICNKSYIVPGTNFVIDAGTAIHIPIIGIHHDPEYYPDPDVFDPDRFNKENLAKRPPFTYLPFGEGPRACLGARFGLMQSKVGLLSVIQHFTVTLNEKTPSPIKLDNPSFMLGVKKGIWLNVSKVVK